MAVGFGIIGCGMIANFHARAVADIPGAAVVACYDAVAEAADRFAESNGCTAYHELDKMLANSDVDVVTICTPSGIHMVPALAAAEAGKHVFIEKPLEVTVDRCDHIIRACEKANVKLGVAFQSRFHESSKVMKRAVEEGRFGTVTMGDAYVKWYRSQED